MNFVMPGGQAPPTAIAIFDAKSQTLEPPPLEQRYQALKSLELFLEILERSHPLSKPKPGP